MLDVIGYLDVMTRYNKRFNKKVCMSCTDDTLSSVVTQMVDFHVHRVWITDSNQVVVGVVTHSDIISEILQGLNSEEL